MADMKKKRRAGQQKRKIYHHRKSVVMISGVMLLLVIVLAVGGMSLRAKNKAYQIQKQELEKQIEEAKERSEEIDELEGYVGSDSYIEEIARDKLGLVYPDEVVLEPEN